MASALPVSLPGRHSASQPLAMVRPAIPCATAEDILLEGTMHQMRQAVLDLAYPDLEDLCFHRCRGVFHHVHFLHPDVRSASELGKAIPNTTIACKLSMHML